MKKIHTLFVLLAAGATALLMPSCGTREGGSDKGGESTSVSKGDADVINTDATDAIPMKEFAISEGEFRKIYNVADIDDAAAIYKEKVDPEKALIVISKREYRLYVYETGSDTTLAASFPVCYALNTGQKTKDGDSCTPHCTMEHPFHVSEIKDASDWEFDFEDGRGKIPAFGHWFIRLDLSKSFPDNEKVAKNRSIGIHGSTGNEASVPGRDSHGCIRLFDPDLITLHDNYVGVGTTVVVKPYDQGKLPFELKAEKALGDKYKPAHFGNRLFKTSEGDDNGVG